MEEDIKAVRDFIVEEYGSEHKRAGLEWEKGQLPSKVDDPKVLEILKRVEALVDLTHVHKTQMSWGFIYAGAIYSGTSLKGYYVKESLTSHAYRRGLINEHQVENINRKRGLR